MRVWQKICRISLPDGGVKIAAALLMLWLLSLVSVGASGAQSKGTRDSLYDGFQNPPHEYDVFPFWTWNGRIEVQEAKRQIDEMLSQGVNRAIVYPFPNMRIRFLSEDWWRIWRELLAYAQTKGFQLGVNIENTFPDGDAHDQWLDPPDQSLVLQGHPEYHMKRLAYVQREFVGPGSVRINDLPHPVIAVACGIKGPDEIDGNNLMDLSGAVSGSNFSADLPSGNWRLMFFYLENATGASAGLHTDPLNHDAMARFIDLTLGEFYRRFKEYFGTTFTFVTADNEGDYGSHIAWTPALFETFRAQKGYDLKKYLPLLVYEGGKQTPKIRIDYLRVISDLFQRNYWGQMAEWSEAHHLQFTGQGWSESLQYDAAFDGDYMQMNRALSMPGVEAISNRGRSPREFMEDESIKDFENRRYWCEGSLVLGYRSYVSPQKERYATNMLGLWGIDLFTTQFYYNVPGMEYPPDDFISQPWWKYFRHYTDYVRRISYMNGSGKHVVDLLLYRPTDTTFAYSSPIFQEGARRQLDLGPDSAATVPSTTSMIRDSGYEKKRHGPTLLEYYPVILWNNNFATKLEVSYYDLMELLTGHQRAFDVADDYYLERMKLERGTLNIAGMPFRGIILPPTKVISRQALSRIRQFYDAGGLVVAYGSLPSASSEEGWNDPTIAADVKAIFGVGAEWSQNAENHNAEGGKSYFLVGNVEHVLRPLEENLPADFQVVTGSPERVLYLHHVKDGQDVYWVVNDRDRSRDIVVSLAARGKPELWDPATGERRETAYWVREGRTFVPLHFDRWDATYVVLDKTGVTAPGVNITSTNLEGYTFGLKSSGGIEVKGRVPSSAPQIYVEGEEGGKKFRVEMVNQKRAEPQVLTSQGWRFKAATKKVEVKYAREEVMPEDEGLAMGVELPHYNDRVWQLGRLSPEHATIRKWWVIGPFPNPNHGEGYNVVYPPENKIDLDKSYVGANGAEVGWRRYVSTRPEINLSEALGSSSTKSAVGYAASWVYSPRAQQVRSILAGKNSKLWVNGQLVYGRYDNPYYFELRDPFGHERNVELKSGWNEVLVKITGPPDSGNTLLFYLRFADTRGLPVEGLIAGWTPSDAEIVRMAELAKQENTKFERWYRIEVPAGTRAWIVPEFPHIEAAYLNARELKPIMGRIEYPRLDFREHAVLAIKIRAGEEFMDPLVFESAETNYSLQSWTSTGLSYYAGSAVYEKTFHLAPELEGKKVVLDCGRVGVVAEIWLNGKKVGERVWDPFSVDVTTFLKPGNNQLKIVVTNSSDAALRAIPDLREYLAIEDSGGYFQLPPVMDAIDMNGLMGPVRLIPYRAVQLSIPGANGGVSSKASPLAKSKLRQ